MIEDLLRAAAPGELADVLGNVTAHRALSWLRSNGQSSLRSGS